MTRPSRFMTRLSRVMTRPAGRVRKFPKYRGSSRVGGQEVFETSRVGLGRVGSGRVGSGQEGFKSHGTP